MRKCASFAAAWFTVACFFSPLALAEQAPEVAPQEEPEEPTTADAAPEGTEETPAQEQEPPAPGVESNCSDGIDNDEDGDIDCNDYDCLDEESCYVTDNDTGRAAGTDDEEPTPPVTFAPTPGRAGRDAENRDDLLEVPEAAEDEGDDEWNDRPVDMFELHGYLRLRGDLFHNLHIDDNPAGEDAVRYFHPRPIEDGVNVCEGVGSNAKPCENTTFVGANMRFRLEPVINLGDQVRILSQIDLLDNLVLGTTPEGYYFDPAGHGGVSPWVPLRAFAGTQVAPNGRNSLTEAVAVKRVWGEVTTPFGQLHFGRMGSHWGLGMLANNGNGLDDDYGDTADRILLATRLWGILLVPGVEFVSTGKTTQTWGNMQGQPIDAGQLDDVMQYFLMVARQLPREEQEERIRRGDLVLNGGLYFTFRNQVLSQEYVPAYTADLAEGSPDDPASGLVYRNAWALVPDLWFQLYYRGFHLELEFAFVGGKVGNVGLTQEAQAESNELRQFGGVARGDFTALGGQLNVGLEFGYASGDEQMEGLTPYQTGKSMGQLAGFKGSSRNTLFRFDPDYNVDLILFEQILGQVAGAAYLKPWVSYEFIRNTVGARASAVYSLATAPISTLGNSPHLGVELNAQIWYRANAPHNFYAMLQYGVLFPLNAWKDPNATGKVDLEFPQTVQAMIAIPY